MRHRHALLVQVMHVVTNGLAFLAFALFAIGIYLCATGKGGM